LPILVFAHDLSGTNEHKKLSQTFLGDVYFTAQIETVFIKKDRVLDFRGLKAL
jgi:hypothetical protein